MEIRKNKMRSENTEIISLNSLHLSKYYRIFNHTLNKNDMNCKIWEKDDLSNEFDAITHYNFSWRCSTNRRLTVSGPQCFINTHHYFC